MEEFWALWAAERAAKNRPSVAERIPSVPRTDVEWAARALRRGATDSAIAELSQNQAAHKSRDKRPARDCTFFLGQPLGPTTRREAFRSRSANFPSVLAVVDAPRAPLLERRPARETRFRQKLLARRPMVLGHEGAIPGSVPWRKLFFGRSPILRSLSLSHADGSHPLEECCLSGQR